jgi:hypothetical protein
MGTGSLGQQRLDLVRWHGFVDVKPLAVAAVDLI